jgi:hypothetical protein
MSEFKIPTETIELPSKGLLYPETSALSSGTIEMKYMSAVEEDILTNQSYIKNGTVLDKLMKSLIISDINYDELLIGDKNAIMVAARILGYGQEYSFDYDGEQHTVDLSDIENKPLHEDIVQRKTNNFEFVLPHTKNHITFRLLTHKDEQDINREIEGLKKINKESSKELTTRLKYIITSVEGKTEKSDVREFVDKYLLAKDSRALREYIKTIQPDVDLSFFPSDGGDRVNLPVGLSFFWPDI